MPAVAATVRVRARPWRVAAAPSTEPEQHDDVGIAAVELLGQDAGGSARLGTGIVEAPVLQSAERGRAQAGGDDDEQGGEDEDESAAADGELAESGEHGGPSAKGASRK